jgi:hypothetical protein
MRSGRKEFIVEWEKTKLDNAERVAAAFSMVFKNSSSKSFPQAGIDRFSTAIKDQSDIDPL